MKTVTTAYTAGIEKVILDHILQAKKSVHIAVAWFTNDSIKDTLIQCKMQSPGLVIDLLVDNNPINEAYFYNYRQKFEQAGIVVHSKARKKFLHSKFMLIDGIWSLSGSYNFTNNAKRNSEQAVLSNEPSMYGYLLRVFRFLTDTDYVDQNLLLFNKYPEFGREIISAFYAFSKREYLRHKDKIAVGHCVTVDNGNWDAIYRAPGLLFNVNLAFTPDLGTQEFIYPITKQDILSWTERRNELVIINYYQDKPHLYDYINEELEGNRAQVIEEFNAKLREILPLAALEALIRGEADIIIEDYIWLTNFLPFITPRYIDAFFSGLPALPQQGHYGWPE